MHRGHHSSASLSSGKESSAQGSVDHVETNLWQVVTPVFACKKGMMDGPATVLSDRDIVSSRDEFLPACWACVMNV
jgi:hypothetical protein